jgi:hypothetical protein
MKKQSRRARGTSTAPAPLRHQFDTAVPTVIHHPEEKMTALARFTQRLLREPRKYLTWVLGVAAVVLGALAISNYTSSARSGSSAVWEKLEGAKTPEDRVSVAKEFPKSSAAIWALLQAGSEFYNLGVLDLPNNRDVAGPRFKKAIELFDQVARAAPKDSFEARLAGLGKARALEASYDLAKAVEQYNLVASNWPGTPEAEEAKELAQALLKPEAAAFYKDLYSYAPTKFTLPPNGTETIMPPLSGLPTPGLGSGPFGTPASISTIPLKAAPSSEPSANSSAGHKDLPADVFSKPADTRPADSKPADTKPADSKPAAPGGKTAR